MGAGSAQPLRVFVSHTSELAAFPEKRSFVDAACAAVRRAGGVAVAMADFGARDQRSPEVCRAEVLGCDVYLAYRPCSSRSRCQTVDAVLIFNPALISWRLSGSSPGGDYSGGFGGRATYLRTVLRFTSRLWAISALGWRHASGWGSRRC
jgi:Domain of unknown function (DUF4062)